jgi:tetraacyldisaccharide 4'-kinase
MTSIFDYLNPYAYIMRARRRMYERGTFTSSHPGIPVISIGNLAVGGTGKSPMVLRVAKHIIDRGKRVAIVSRGYGRKSKGFVLVRDGSQILAKVDQSGDEAQMLAEELAEAIVIVDEDRVHGAKEARRLGAQVIVLDDGFQHQRLRRDINILLIDAERPLSAVLPFGRFREPFSAARAADAVIFTNAADKMRVRNHWDRLKPYLKPNAIAAATTSRARSLEQIATGQVQALDSLQGARVMSVSSIASPKRFHKMLEALGAEIIVRDLGDHAEYSDALSRAIVRDAERSGVTMIVTTQKDAVKSKRYFERVAESVPVYVLVHELEFLSGEQSLFAVIDQLL